MQILHSQTKGTLLQALSFCSGEQSVRQGPPLPVNGGFVGFFFANSFLLQKDKACDKAPFVCELILHALFPIHSGCGPHAFNRYGPHVHRWFLPVKSEGMTNIHEANM
jgi:hypothetical protein